MSAGRNGRRQALPRHGKVDYLRLSVTDRCNFRCVYCMPPEGVPFKAHEEILSYEDMVFFVSVAVEFGISKVRLTGGEPLVRRDLPHLVQELLRLDDVHDVSLTTNGALLPRFAEELAAAGLSRVNVSLDSLDPGRYGELTRGGRLADALAGVEAALVSGFQPVKVNAVMLRPLLGELEAFVGLTRDRPLHVRFIEQMTVGGCGPAPEGRPLSRAELQAAICRISPLEPVGSPGGYGPARYFKMAGHAGTIGFISSVSDHFCRDCNRLRMTAEGRLKSCLFSDEEEDAAAAIRARDRSALRRLIGASLAGKTYDRPGGSAGNGRTMSQIGG